MTNGRPTYAERLCEAGIEGCWLAAVVVTPLFFNVYSHRVFEPDKATILRLLALILGFLWIVRTVERSGSKQRVAIVPMALASVLVVLVAVEATVLSVSPRVSLWGSYNRLQGLYTTAAYVAVFLSVVGLLRTRDQIERVVSTALLTSLPVSLYGIIQYFGTDPLRWGADVTVRVTSTLGNPIFLAAFLILTVPLTLYRLIGSADLAGKNESPTTKRLLMIGGLASLAFQMIAWMSGPIAGTASAVITVGTWIAASLQLRRPLVPFLSIGAYSVLLSAQLMCILFSQSRGPWLALAGGLFLFALLWALIYGSRRRVVAVIGTGLAVILAVGVLNWPGSPLGFVRDVPYLGRAAQIAKTETGSGRVRVLIWEGVSELLADDPGRGLIGYGPETMNLVFPPHHSPELHRIKPDAAADRAHNETFDVLVTTGLFGLVAYLLLWTGLFYAGLRWIDLLQTRKTIHAFLWLWFGGGAAGVAVASLLDGGWRFSGIALPIGMFCGLLLFIFTRRRDGSSERASSPGNDASLRLLGVTMLSILAVHFLEVQIGLAVVATRTYFWIFAAVVVVGIRRIGTPADPREPAPGAPVRDSMETPPIRSVIAGSLAAGLVLLTLIYDFYLPNLNPDRAGPVFWLFTFGWAFGGLLVITNAWPGHSGEDNFGSWVKALVVYSLVTLTLAPLYALIHGIMLGIGIEEQSMIVGYVGALLIVLLVSPLATRSSMRLPDRIRAPVYLLLAVGAVLAADASLDVVRADVHFRKANGAFELRRYPDAAAELRRAVRLAPHQDTYRLFLGKALLEQARTAKDRDSLMQEAERALLKAVDLSPLDPNHAANLARLYQAWAKESQPGTARNQRLQVSLDLFARATTLNPNRPPLWNERANAYLSAGDTVEARRMYEHSLELDEALFETHLLVGDLHLTQRRWQEAIGSYQEALRLKPGLPLVELKLAIARARLEP